MIESGEHVSMKTGPSMETGEALERSTMEPGSDLVGSFHCFGEHGPAYEVIGIEAQDRVLIRVVETGETLAYPIEEVRRDPRA